MNFCNEFLNHVKTVVTREYNECIYNFEYNLDDRIEMKSLSSNSEFSFLPDWYIHQLHQIMKT